MEERTHAPGTPRPAIVDVTVDPSGSLDPAGPAPAGPAPAGPAPAGSQVPLPFDDEAEQPIGFRLTARARRTVAPDALPALRVVPPPAPASRPERIVRDRSFGGPRPADEPADDDPSDTRPARARALRRAGVDLAAIAAQLGVDELLVRAWTGGVVAARRPARVVTSTTPVAVRGPGEVADPAPMRAVRDAARAAAARRLVAEPGLAAGVGVLAGVAEVGSGAITVTTTDPRIAGCVVRWLVDVLDVDPAAVRLVLRVGPRAAADLARHRWGRAVGLDPDRVRTTRAGAPADEAAVEGVLRIAGADLAATAAGWCDALLDGDVSAGF